MNSQLSVTNKQASALKPAEANPTPTSFRGLSLVLFLFLFAVYLLTYSPRFHSSDGLAMFATSESLARRGEWDADQIRWMGLAQGVFGIDGHLYIRKGVGVSLLALPLVWLGLIVPIWGPATTALLLNSITTAATGALLFLYLAELGYQHRVGLVASLTFGLATLAWPYAKTFFSDPLASLCLVGAGLALLRFRHTGRAIWALWAGLALAVAVAARYANAVIIPFYGLLLINYQIARAKSRTTNSKSPITSLKSLISNPRPWIVFGIPLIATAIAIAFYNLARYGDPLNTGYLPEESFSGIWWQGIAGLLFSPGRGLFLYAPVLLVALLTTPAFFRRHQAEAALAGAVILVHLLVYGKWFMWHGGYAWGPRFLVPTMPFFVMVMIPAIEWAKESIRWRVGFLTLAGLSILLQVLGLSVHFELFQGRLLDTGLPLFAPITFFALRYSPLLGQFSFLRPEHLDFAWMSDGQLDLPLLIALMIAVLLSGWWLFKTLGRPDAGKTGRPPSSRPTNLPILQSAIPPTLLILAVTAWLLARAHASHPDNLRDPVAILNTHTTAADAVVTGTPDESVAFADLYKGRADVLGLSAGSPFDADIEAALTESAQRHPHVWWLPNWLPSAESSIERWLMGHGFRVEDQTIGERRLALYYFPPEPLIETGTKATFGDAIILEGAQTPLKIQAGDVLPVALHWQVKQAVKADYYVFVHLLDADGNRVAQSDGQPALWTRPTSSWLPGDHILDHHALRLPTTLRPGNYTLIAGLYLPENGERLLSESGEAFVYLGSVQSGE